MALMENSTGKEIETKILNTFASVASTMGYSPIHGKIIGVLTIKGRPVPLQDIAKTVGYSVSMVSISIDFLELTGVVKRVKKTGDRQLYIEMQSDLLEALKTLVLAKVSKGIKNSAADFESEKKRIKTIKDPLERAEMERAVDVLEKEIKRLDRYVSLLAAMKL
jgi:DNA-binding transcriptional regulator GbsR (MarR family)